MQFESALSYLLGLGHETLTIKLGLKNTETLLAALGNPHSNFPAVQIAGTNGKGSTAVMLDSICRRAGIRTGLFTSPHLISITERIRIDGREVSENEFSRFTSEVKNAAQELVARGDLPTLPTFFEHLTAIALLAFGEAGVDLAILETGLGGRLDSTTAAAAEIVAITPIAMDHEEYLGSTIAEIAAEKAAIIRPGTTPVIGPQRPEALDVIMRRCAETAVTPRVLDDPKGGSFRAELTEVNDGRCRVTFATPNHRYEDVWLGLRGRHQIDNAGVALALAEALRERGFQISSQAIVDGLENASHAGRLELRPGQPAMLFDGAHNPAAARVLADYLDEFAQVPITLVFGAMKDKRLHEMAGTLFPKAQLLILTRPDNPRAADVEELAEAVPKGYEPGRVRKAASVSDALQIAGELTRSDGLICVTGSLYLIGAVQQVLQASSGPF